MWTTHVSRFWTGLVFHILLLEFTCRYLVFAGELRFCYKGPQRILFKDCPGGFVAKMPVRGTCMYYRKAEDTPDMDVYLSRSICNISLSENQLDAVYQDFDEAIFQSIQFDADDNSDRTDGAEPEYEKCNATCFEDYVDPKYWTPTKIFKDKHPIPDSDLEKFQTEYNEKTKELMVKMINAEEYDNELCTNVDGENSEEEEDFLQGNSTLLHSQPITTLMKVLAKTMRILYKRCSPFIESSFYNLVFRTMLEFRKMGDRTPDLNILPMKRILKILEACETEKVPHFMINGTQCEERTVVQTITDLKNNVTQTHKLQETSFRWGRYDPIVEAAWNAVDFVHGYCFDHFAEDMLHYSLFVVAMSKFFTQPVIEKHWMYPFPVGKEMTMWTIAYDTPDIKGQMMNLDACVQAAYAGSVFESRLDRPFVKEEFAANPEYEDDPTPPPTGWTKSAAAYWKMYENTGFQDMVNELGFCVKKRKGFDMAIDAVAEKTCFLDSV